MTAAGRAAGPMTSGSTGTGGLPVVQERANPHKRTQTPRERALFNAVMNLLEARNQPLLVLTSLPGRQRFAKEDKGTPARGTQSSHSPPALNLYGNWWRRGTHPAREDKIRHGTRQSQRRKRLQRPELCARKPCDTHLFTCSCRKRD